MATTPILTHDDVAPSIDPRVAAFESSVEATLLIDPFGDLIVDANPAACALLGYDRALLRQTRPSTLHAGELPALTVFTQAVLHKGAYWTTALNPRHATGQNLRLEYAACVLRRRRAPGRGRGILAQGRLAGLGRIHLHADPRSRRGGRCRRGVSRRQPAPRGRREAARRARRSRSPARTSRARKRLSPGRN